MSELDEVIAHTRAELTAARHALAQLHRQTVGARIEEVAKELEKVRDQRNDDVDRAQKLEKRLAPLRAEVAELKAALARLR